MRKVLFVSVPGLLVVGVLALLALRQSAEDQALLGGVEAELQHVRDKDSAVAEHLDEYKTQTARLDSDLKKLEVSFGPLEAAKLLAAAEAAAPGAKLSWAAGAFEVRDRTSALATLGRINAAHGGLDLTSLVIEREAWTAKLASMTSPLAAAQPRTRAQAPDTPWCLMGCAKIRARIAGLNGQIDELERLIGDVASFEGKRTQLQRELDLVNADRQRLWRSLSILEELFGGAKPVFATGTVAQTPSAMTVTGTFAPGVDPASFAARAHGFEILRVDATGATVSDEHHPAP